MCKQCLQTASPLPNPLSGLRPWTPLKNLNPLGYSPQTKISDAATAVLVLLQLHSDEVGLPYGI